MLTGLLRKGGLLLALALVAVAAVASLFGPNEVARVTGSFWFTGVAGLCGLASLVAAVVLLRQRRLLAFLPHLGLLLGLVGVMLNHVADRGGYMFLPAQAGARNYCLGRNLRQVEELPFAVHLDSLGAKASRGFRLAPVAFVRGTSGAQDFSAALTFNRTLTVAGYRLMLSRVVEPGFLDEYELIVDGTEYALMHNQHILPRPGLKVWSFGFDTEEQRVGLLVGTTRQWLAVGDSATVSGTELRLTAASFAPTRGAILVVNDIRLRPVLFIGFGLVLAGLLLPLLRREER